MDNKERLREWYKEQQEKEGLVDIKFFVGEISTSSENSICGAALVALEQDRLGNSYDIEEL